MPPSSTEPHPMIQGGFINVFDQGVLLTGPSGIGKSELLLALIERGHQLISDDVTLIHRDGQRLVGSAPERLAGMMQIHGCGLFSVTELYGPQACMAAKPLQLVIALDPAIEFEENPLEAARSSLTLLNLVLPRVVIPIPKPRNLPLIIELLVRKEIAEK